MSTEIVQLEHARPLASEPPVERNGDEILYPDHPHSVARGIVSAVLISIPFWTLFVFALYLLI